MKPIDMVPPPVPDWTNTSLGAPAHWPAPLRLTVDLMLNSPLAQLLMWGHQQIMVYNEAYVRLTGATTLHAPGGMVPPVLPPAWSWNNAAIAAAWAGQAGSYHHQMLPVWRAGAPAQLPFDLYYTPVPGADGQAGGILCALTPAAEPIPAARSLRILLVEDHPDARYLASETLRALGHQVCCAASAETALPQLANQAFDVLLTDVGLPGMSGVELARLALRTAPRLRLLFASGYGDHLTGKLDLPAVALRKPYDVEQLQQALGAISASLQDDQV